MYKCILVPTDGSEFCERAIRHGVSLAKFTQAKVIGLTGVSSSWLIGKFWGLLEECKVASAVAVEH